MEYKYINYSRCSMCLDDVTIIGIISWSVASGPANHRQ